MNENTKTPRPPICGHAICVDRERCCFNGQYTNPEHTCYGAIFLGTPRALAQAGCPVCPEGDPGVEGPTERTDDVVAWLEAKYPEGDASVSHTEECDRVSCGDECIGGCEVLVGGDDELTDLLTGDPWGNAARAAR